LEFGKVYIVGAGPGDPELITIKALNKLKEADVVVYDRLINDDLLDYCKIGCEKIFVGKESGYHPIKQEEITKILITKSKLGYDVVRLKGGNPFVFGRGSEEAAALKKEGIDFEIVPGITSGLSAPIYGGIPITHRGLITQCVLITAHECPSKPETQVDWEKLAKLKNANLIIYMGASRIEKICSELIKHGMSPSMPAAAIENGTMQNQRTITASLDNLAYEFRKENFKPPVIIMISPTVSLRNDVSWFEKTLIEDPEKSDQVLKIFLVD
jgi:uroporphyrin-III C-methyltransferase